MSPCPSVGGELVPPGVRVTVFPAFGPDAPMIETWIPQTREGCTGGEQAYTYVCYGRPYTATQEEWLALLDTATSYVYTPHQVGAS